MSRLRSASALVGVFVFVSASAPAADVCGPLFVVRRSLNANVVLYEAGRKSDGTLDSERPVRPIWRLDARDGRREDLNFVERLRAYGVDVAPAGDDGARTFTVRALRSRPLVLREGEGCPYVTATIDGKDAVLRGVYVQATGGLLPKVSRVELSGIDLATAQPVSESFSPTR